jgi:antitoxin (DNA-binding transcriptional repressor) of toxin-antitoxin stability system
MYLSRTGACKEANMAPISVEEAQDRLPELMEEAAGGEDVVIARADGSAFRLVPIEMAPRPRFGSARGLFTMADDFDASLEDFRDYEQ